MDDDIQIKKEDAERIDDIVNLFRSRVTSLYKMAYLQGAIDAENAALRKLKEAA